MSELRFDGRVVVITGAGNGLGKSHALLFASRGAKVVINDLGGKHDGTGKGLAAADAVVAEIKEKGGDAVANYDSVEDGAKIIQTAIDTWGKVDVVVNNAGILRDTSFQKMTDDAWDIIYRVHVLGAYRVTKAAWDRMREQGFGRIIMTASAAGIYGNFGQANYAMAKLGLVGFAQTLAIEGQKKNVHVNAIAPIAGSRMTETVLPPDLIASLKPEYVSPLVAWLCHESCEENGGLFEVGGGFMGKLRWERAAGKVFKLGNIRPEDVQKNWTAIGGFERTTHPTDITSSMQPILGNLGTKSLGGNEFIDCDEALGADLPVIENSYNERDVALYALGVGAAENPSDPKDLNLVYELSGDGFHVLPTFAVVPAINCMMEEAKRGNKAPGLHYGFERILHGEQYTEVRRPLPTHARLKHKPKITAIYDKGKNAVVVTAITTTDADTGEELAYNEFTSVIRGAGGWGGDRGPTTEANVAPDRAPDAVVEEKTHPNQALLYRLSGDINPLHADPSFAVGFGFAKPILHGLCTFGFATRAVINKFAGGDPRFFKSIKVRFAEVVFPGETLVTEMWKDGEKVTFRTKVKERDKVVISNASLELFKEIPKPKAKTAGKPAAAASSAVSGEPISADVFEGIRAYFTQNAADVKKIGVTYQFKLAGPDSLWTLDTKTASVSAGETAKSECTLDLSDADFMRMCTGKADPMKLFMDKKLKISGNVMASQKLEFLKKIDPNLVMESAKKRGGNAGVAVLEAAPTPADGSSGDVFVAIQDHVEKNKADLAKIGVVYLFKLTSPESAWTVDLKTGSVAQGEAAKAECTLELSDADFMDMTSGKADAMKLFMDKKLKISGNVMASQKLDFLKKIDKDAAAKAVAAKKAPAASKGSTTATAPPKSATANAAAVFAALEKRFAENKSLGKELGTVAQFKITGPDATYVVDGIAGSVKEGTDAKPAATLTISDADLTALVKGQATPQSLYQHGLLRVEGDVRVAHKLGIFNGLV